MDNPDTSTPAQGDVPSTQPAQTNHGSRTMSSVPPLTSSNASSSNSPPTTDSPPSHAGTNENNRHAVHPTPPTEPVDRLPPPNSGRNIPDNATTALKSSGSGLSHMPTTTTTNNNNTNRRAGNPTPPFSPIHPVALCTTDRDPVASNTLPISSPDSIKRRRSGSFDDQEVKPEPCQSAVVPTSHNDMSNPLEDISRKRRRVHRHVTFVLPMKPDVTNDDADSDDEDGGASVGEPDSGYTSSCSSWGSDMSWEEAADDDDDDDEDGGAPAQSQQGAQLPSMQDHLKRPSVQSLKLAPLRGYGSAQSSSEKMFPRIKKRPGLELSRLKQFRPVTQEAAARHQGAAAPVWDFPIYSGLDEEAYVRPCNKMDYETAQHPRSDMACTNSAEDLDSSQRYAKRLPHWADLRNGAHPAALLYERLEDKIPGLHPTCVADLSCKVGDGTLAILGALPENCAVQGWDSNDDFVELAKSFGKMTLDNDDTRIVNFGMMSIQEFVPQYEDLVLCMDAMQVMSRRGRLFHMSRILSKMDENAVLAVWMPNSCSLPYALFRQTVEERGPWNKWFETQKIEYLTGAQAFMPLEPMVQWEAAVAPFSKAFLVKEAVDPYPIPKGHEDVWEWMTLEAAPMAAQLDNDPEARSAFLKRYKGKLAAAYKPKFGQRMTMGITGRYLFAVRGPRGCSATSDNSDVDSEYISSDDYGPETPPKEDEFGQEYFLKSASGASPGTATGYVLPCSHAGSFSCPDVLCPRRDGPPLGEDVKKKLEDMLSKLEASLDDVKDAKTKMKGMALEPEQRAALQSLVQERDELLGSLKTIRESVGGLKAPWTGGFSPGDIFCGSEEEFQAVVAIAAMASKEGGAAGGIDESGTGGVE